MGIELRGLVDVTGRLARIQSGMSEKAAAALNIVGFSAVAIAQLKSPVAHKDGGTFRAAWQVQQYAGAGCIAGVEVQNNLKYSRPLEYGSKQGSRPWPNAGPLTVVNNGRVFSKQAPEGVLTPELERLKESAAKLVLEELLK